MDTRYRSHQCASADVRLRYHERKAEPYHVEKVKQEDELVADTTVQEAKVNFPIIRVQVGEPAQ
jgi:hypothetical protein